MSATGLPHPVLVDLARSAIAAGRVDAIEDVVSEYRRTVLQPVINATGVLLHTNLGRAPFAAHQEARYSNLELDLSTGSRGSRNAHAATLLAQAAGAEAGLVVNNGAAAVLLVLAALAGPEHGVAVSRSELVEIGGGFRIPDVMEQSGARLIEVGTTNRTRLADYTAVVGGDADLVLQVHRSNYEITGFTEAASTGELATLDAPLVVDLGSGLLDTRCPWLEHGPPRWLGDEPGVRQTLDAGADVVIFSGDKLLGGPQAGIIVGSAEQVARCARHPLARALRCGDLVLAALSDLAIAYLRRDGQSIPFWHMATRPTDELAVRAEAIAHNAPGWIVVECESVTGGGTLPSATIASVGLAAQGDHTVGLIGSPIPVVARVEAGSTICDLRTVDANDDEALAETLTAVLTT
jgi:L-seryl-tRNA(Ser) seleniumtransferase